MPRPGHRRARQLHRVLRDEDDRPAVPSVHEREPVGGGVVETRPEGNEQVGLVDPAAQPWAATQAEIAGVGRAPVVHRVLPAERGDHRDRGGLGEPADVLADRRRPARSTDDHDRSPRSGQQPLQRLEVRGAARGAVRQRSTARTRHRGLAEHVFGDHEHDRARTSRCGPPRRRGRRTRDAVGVVDLHDGLGRAAEDQGVVHLLERLPAQECPGHLPDDEQQRRAVLVGGVQGDARVRRARTARDEADGGPAGELAGSLGHVGCRGLVPRGDQTGYVVAGPQVVERVKDGQEALARHAGHQRDAGRHEALDEQPSTRPSGRCRDRHRVSSNPARTSTPILWVVGLARQRGRRQGKARAPTATPLVPTGKVKAMTPSVNAWKRHASAPSRTVGALAAGALVVAGLTVSTTPAAVAAAAPDAPGAVSHFDLARKDCLGTARNTTSKVWYTVAGGVLSDVYYPTIDNTNVETLQYVVTDGSTFTDLQTRDMTYTVKSLDRSGLACRVTSTGKNGATRSSPTTSPTRSAPASSCTARCARPTGPARRSSSSSAMTGRSTATAAAEPTTAGPTTPSSTPPLGPPCRCRRTSRRRRTPRTATTRTPVFAALRADRPFLAASSGYAGTASDGLSPARREPRARRRPTTALPAATSSRRRRWTCATTNSFTLALGFGATQTDASATAGRSASRSFDKTSAPLPRRMGGLRQAAEAAGARDGSVQRAGGHAAEHLLPVRQRAEGK